MTTCMEPIMNAKHTQGTDYARGKSESAIHFTPEGVAALIAQRAALLEACRTHPLPPSDFDTLDGKEAFCDAVMQWINGPVAAAIAKATEGV